MNANFDLSQKVAVVTGGGQGIGVAVADRLASAGASVIVADLNEPEYTNHRFFRCDVSLEQEVANLVAFADEKYGRIDIMVNNAGVHTDYNRLEDVTQEALVKCFSVNTNGVAWGIKYASKIMQAGGTMVNMSSASAVMGVSGLAPYAASKAGVLALTQTAAIELAPRNIRVNAICPGSVRTPMALADGGEALLAVEAEATPLGRICEPEEVAALVHFLSADDCGFLTGQCVNLCGGLTAGLSDNLWARLTG